MTKILMVAKREYLYNLRRPAFLFAAFGAPIIAIVAMVIVVGVLSNDAQDTESIGQVGYVDQSGILADAVDQPEAFAPYDTREAAQAALDDGTIGAYFVIDDGYIQNGNVEAVSERSIPEAISDEMDAFLVSNLSKDIQDV
ncbi:MAG: ABC transporter permease, partial [Anaerolineae bacterium]|nr:ABC transporter permease [Anaerolineae bacterium]